jgi:beta-glucanase (GH16 family)
MALILALLMGALPLAAAQDEGPEVSPLLDVANASSAERLAPSSEQVSVAPSADAGAPGLVVTIQPGEESYPGVRLTPEAGVWDLSAFGHVEARVVNLGERRIAVTLRVDNAGDWRQNPWNAEPIRLDPGASGSVKTIFGFSYGHKPGYKLDPSAVTGLLLFAGKSDAVQAFRIELVAAGGPGGEKPPVDPRSVRILPEDGFLLAPGMTVEADKQLAVRGAEAVVTDGPSLQVTFAGPRGGPNAQFKPPIGRWDLRQCIQATVNVRNGGQMAVTPRVRLESNRGPSDWVAAEAPLAPGAATEIRVPFAAATPWEGERRDTDPPSWRGKPGTGTRFGSDAVSAVTVSAVSPEEGSVLVVESITAGLPAGRDFPEWLGQRPPVAGDWVQTFNDDFDGTELDLTKWNNTGPNYWDRRSHWSKDNVIVADGVARMRYERKRGRHNDEPDGRETDWQGGLLETYGKWMQKYGYFEARMKLPTAPGLWPAFWMMPDRGVEAGEQWRRQSTHNGGMEFDIMEHLTRWGPWHYHIAMHWDGYQDEHKSMGSSGIYVQPDEDGFFVSGLLWLPGLAVWYANGREVARWEDPRVCSVQMDMMFTMPQGGWDNSPIDASKLPDDFVIDYVRVWQRRDLLGE